jgi:iron uptake system component EfeO
MTIRPIVAIATAAALLVALTACVENSQTPSDGSTTISVESSATACTLSSNTAPSGTITFTVTNTGDEVTEFYVLADDGARVVGEVENVGPGIERDLVLDAKPGIYYTKCKPGMTGDGLGTAEFTVTDAE